jgi:hypothetical protein
MKENYRRPEWQRKRLEIMDRDGFACQNCGDKDAFLNVHHRYYVAGRMPWEYPAFALITLCECCHQKNHQEQGSENFGLWEYFFEECGVSSELDQIKFFDAFFYWRCENQISNPLQRLIEIFEGKGMDTI